MGRSFAERRLEMFRVITDSSFEPAIWVRADASIFYVNEATSRLTGVDKEQLLGMSVSDFDPTAAETFTPQWQALELQGSARFETEMLDAQGDMIPIEVTGSMVEAEGDKIGALFIRDLRESRDREAERDALQQRTATAQRLEDLGFHAERVERAESALDQVQADPSRFDLVITDLSMPGLDGMQLARALKDVSPEMPVVVMTGNVGDLDTKALERTGVAAVMRKPFGRPELEEMLAEVLTRKSG